jgi:MOSC domain-containing protein YiiM
VHGVHTPAAGATTAVLARVASVNVGQPRALRTPEDLVRAGLPERTYRTAIRKSPVCGPVRVGRLGLQGDGQADVRHHGGPDKAVCVHFLGHLRWWGERRGRPVAPGELGENLTLAPADPGGPEPDESSFCIGDVLAVGSALLEVSQPRIPCFKQAWQLALGDGVARAVAAGRVGLYCRVLREGQVAAGDPVWLVRRPHPEASVAEVHRIFHHARHERERLLGLPALGADLRRDLLR